MPTTSTTRRTSIPPNREKPRHEPVIELPPLPADLLGRLRDDIRLRGIQIPILVDHATGEIIDGKQRQQIAVELGIKNIPTIYVSRLDDMERADLRVALNLYRRHLSRSQMREFIAWELKKRPGSSDRSVAGRTGVNHRTVASVRSGLEANGEILRYETHSTSNGKQYPVAAKPSVFACSSAQGRRARVLLDRLGDEAPHRTASIQVLHKLANRKERDELKTGPEARLPAHIRIECCDFRELAVPSGSLDLIFTDPPWGTSGRRLIPDFAAWAFRTLKPGGLLLVYTGHIEMLQVGSAIAKKLNYLWTISCVNGNYRGRNTRHDLGIRCCWRPLLMFCRGKYHPTQVIDDAIVSSDKEKSHHDHQQPLSEALFYIKTLTRPRAVIGDPFLGSGTTACAVASLGHGRKFCGSEIDPDTCKIARNRVAEELRSRKQ